LRRQADTNIHDALVVALRKFLLNTGAASANEASPSSAATFLGRMQSLPPLIEEGLPQQLQR
jgi:hypothetical protein